MNARFEQIVCDETQLEQYLSQGYIVQFTYQKYYGHEEYVETTSEMNWVKPYDYSNAEQRWSPKYETSKRHYQYRTYFILARRETIAILYGAKNGKTQDPTQW